MALKLHLGGAPAGPAGKGKSETTKDLARAHAIPCYVFNCSNQMNFSPLVTFFEASPKLERLDEFNRIQIEILSVVATQVKTIQDAIVNLSRPENRQENSNRHLGGRPKQGWVLCIHGRYYFTHPNLWLSLYDEPWLRQPNGIAGEPKDFFFFALAP